ncbi:MAG: alpha/beta fold hydrolase [Rhodospirillaceae bacterium]|nr:MAG: alpha/beta fold hydrolase [Rhodospirillaceae bacterium]
MSENPESFIRAIDARATRVETPCGDGTMVWRRWGDGPPLVFFHGASGAWTHWIRTIEDLSTDHTLWIPDLPGNGESVQPMPHNDIDAAAAAVLQGLDIILPRETFRVVAFSAGLVLGAEAASRRAGRVDQLVVASAGAVGPIVPLPMRSLRGITDPDEIDAVNRHNLATLMLADPHNVDDLALFIHRENSRRGRFHLRYIEEGAPALDRLKTVRAPVAVIWGGLDAARPDVTHYRQLFDELRPGLPFHVIDGAGHWVMYDAPARFNATLRTLLAGRP